MIRENNPAFDKSTRGLPSKEWRRWKSIPFFKVKYHSYLKVKSIWEFPNFHARTGIAPIINTNNPRRIFFKPIFLYCKIQSKKIITSAKLTETTWMLYIRPRRKKSRNIFSS